MAATLYDQVVHTTHVYLGPAAERFVTRQVENHLHKDPTELTTKDLQQIIDWVRLAVSMLTDDSDIVEEYIAQLHKLTENKAADGSV